MIRRRQPSDPSSARKEVITHGKTKKENGGVRHIRMFLGPTTIIFVILLFVTAKHLDEVNLPHEDRPSKASKNGDGNTKIIKPKVKLNATSFGLETSESIGDIPYVRYEPLNPNVIKERMDHAISRGDANNSSNPNITIGQYLLDFGIIGFAKCGTTTMMRWLNMHENIAVLDQENMSLQKSHPARILRFITRQLPEGRYRRGYKSPNDVSDGRARNKLGIHYPQTKLLIGLRHPVLWFESFYNYRVQNGYTMPNLTEHKLAKFVCEKEFHGACVSRASYHVTLARWGKTPLLSPNDEKYDSFYKTGYKRDDEWSIFSQKEQRDLKNEFNKTAISPNPLFLYDVSQLRVPPTAGKDDVDDEKQSHKRYEDFVLSLQKFLGVPMNVSAMPAMIRESPGRDLNATEQARRDSLKIDICDDKFKAYHERLLEVGTTFARWITNYFSKSPYGVVLGGGYSIEGTSHLLEIIQSYGNDPCLERLSRKGRI